MEVTVSETSCRKPGDGSPLLIDFSNNGFDFGPNGFGTLFDIKSEGINKYYQWVKFDTDDAFLVLDLNGNGVIDSGAELFGEGTVIINTGRKAKNGFLALAQYDKKHLGGNDDGIISDKDKVWTSLGLWTDTDANGISIQKEIIKLDATEIKSIRLDYITQYQIDHAGNKLKYWSSAKTKNGGSLRVVDVYFKEL
jgi:hypothetical protein